MIENIAVYPLYFHQVIERQNKGGGVGEGEYYENSNMFFLFLMLLIRGHNMFLYIQKTSLD